MTHHVNATARHTDHDLPEWSAWLYRRLTALPGFLIALLFSSAVLAQTASDVTPSTFQPELRRLSGALVFSGEPGLQAPAGAERLSVTIADVVIEGTLPGMQDASDAIVARLTGGRIAVSEIFEAAAALEAAYASEGLVLVRVVLPAQRLRDGGRLRLIVVDGFVESIDAAAAPDPVRPRLRSVTKPLIGRSAVRLAEIERQLLLAGDTYGVALGSALSAGATPGGTVVTLDPEYRPVTGFLGFDNSLTGELGSVSVDGGIELNGLLGFGEALYLRASGYPGGNDASGRGGLFDADPRFRTIAAGAVFPLGNDGLSFNLEATQSRTTPDVDGLATASVFERLSLRLYYPWVRSRALNVTTQLSFDAQSDQLDILAVAGDLPVYRDELRVLRLSGDVAYQSDSGASYEAGAVASVGLDRFGARGADDATAALPLSRDGADADFRKFEISGRYRRQLGEQLAFSLNGRAQTSFGQPLMKSEQIGIAATQEISAFDSGTLSGDSGWVVRGELSSPSEVTAMNLPLRLSPYLFLSTGMIYIENPTALEQAKLRVSSAGIGIDVISLGDPQFSTGSVRVEYGKGFRDDDEPGGSRFSVVASVRF